ncbi:MAG: hypothetical protein JNK02_06590 [Planctomycetes bacterium]|nr:hypothetical protein [Planctomycetota bacterium]
MRNVLILGSGRSGTSMVGGTLAHAGWFVGDAPYGARAANPKGFFESPEINGINEDLLAACTPAAEELGPWQRWLARLPRGAVCTPTARSDERIRRAVRRAPWAYKDPRYCYSLPAWEPFVGDALRVCVFRHPAATAHSIEKECREADYLRSVAMTRERALSIWLEQHQSILNALAGRGEWLFLHFEQVLTESGLERLERAVGAPIARAFPDAALKRSPAEGDLDAAVRDTYLELCERAGFTPPRTAVVVPARPPEVRAAVAPRSLPACQVLERAAAERARVHAAVRLAATRHGSVSAPELAFARGLTLATADAYVVERLPDLADLEREARELAALDPRVLRRASIARAVASRLARVEQELLEVARREGLVRGLLELELVSFADLERAAPWPLSTAADRRALAWPVWEREELAALLADAPAALAAVGGAPALCLRHDAQHDGPLEVALAALAEAADALPDSEAQLEVLVVDDRIEPDELPRLGRAVDLWIDLASSERPERARFRAALGLELARHAVSATTRA